MSILVHNKGRSVSLETAKKEMEMKAKKNMTFQPKINKKSKVIISIFAGRAADAGKDPIPEFKKSIAFAKKFKNVDILWASVREPYNYLPNS